eukprot:10359953-Alexandrium_andersonii.AAC.1
MLSVLSLRGFAPYALCLASDGPRAKDCADCGLADCGLEFRPGRFRAFGPPEAPRSRADSESPRKMPQNAPLGSFRGQF